MVGQRYSPELHVCDNVVIQIAKKKKKKKLSDTSCDASIIILASIALVAYHFRADGSTFQSHAIFRDVADILFPFGGIFRHGDTSINICAAGTGDHVTRPSATICERGHVRHSGLTRALARTMLETLETGVWHTTFVPL